MAMPESCKNELAETCRLKKIDKTKLELTAFSLLDAGEVRIGVIIWRLKLALQSGIVELKLQSGVLNWHYNLELFIRALRSGVVYWCSDLELFIEVIICCC